MTGIFKIAFLARTALNFFERVGLGDVEFGDAGAAEGFEVSSAAEALAHFVGYGAHIGSGGYAGAEGGAVGVDGGDGEFLNFDVYRFQNYFLLLAGEFIGGDAFDFFR